jgi:serine/threonine protein phosphatase 1
MLKRDRCSSPFNLHAGRGGQQGVDMLQKHEANTRGRDFFVGDIHGEYRLLQAAMAEVAFDRRTDRLFSVGDLIDRGPESLDCLSLAFEPWCFGVRGNHEMLARAALHEGGGTAWALWMMNGGAWVNGQDVREVRQRLEAALRYLPYAREIAVAGRRVGLVHAEPPPDWSLIEDGGEAIQHALVWGRRRITQRDSTPVAGIDAVVVGHTIVEQPLWLGNVHYIDTGAFHTGRLTLIEAREVISAAERGPDG